MKQNPPSAAAEQRPSPPPLRPPHPHLARYLAEGDQLLDDEQLCACGHLEGDHRVVDIRCSRCQRCAGFTPHPSEADDTQPGVLPPTDGEALATWRGRS